MFKEICSAELYGNKILVPCRYDEILTREYGEGWIKPDKHHFLKSAGKQVFWSERKFLMFKLYNDLSHYHYVAHVPYAYQCLGKNQLSLRDYKFDEHNKDIYGKSKAHGRQSLKDLVELYKSVCNRLRWPYGR